MLTDKHLVPNITFLTLNLLIKLDTFYNFLIAVQFPIGIYICNYYYRFNQVNGCFMKQKDVTCLYCHPWRSKILWLKQRELTQKGKWKPKKKGKSE